MATLFGARHCSIRKLAPNDASAFGASWEFLGTFGISSNTLVVRLSDMANGYVNADAIRIERVGDLPTVVDNADPGFSLSGPGWSGAVGTDGYNGTYRFAAAGSGGNVAQWAFMVTPGQYRVSVTWSPHSLFATNAAYTVLDGLTARGTTRINQEVAPDDVDALNRSWEYLGVYTITSNTLLVRLTDQADHFVNADAVRIERVG